MRPGRASADAEPAAFRTLHQDHRHHGGGDSGLHDQKEHEHVRSFRKSGFGAI
jgi:hypothetical protein